MNGPSELTEQGISGVGRPPGIRLRQERERQGLDIRDVADSLRLASNLIDALEHDRYEELPPPAFVRGYLRSYAELLGVPADDLLRAHTRLQPIAGPVVAPRDAGVSITAAQQRSIASVTGVMLLTLMVAAVWWVTGEQVGADAIPEPVYASLRGPRENDPVSGLGRPVHSDVETGITGPDGKTEDGSALEPPVDGATAPARTAYAGNHEAVVEPGSRDDPATAPASAPAAADDEAVATPPPAVAMVDTGRLGVTVDRAAATTGVELELVMDGESWVEIQDAAGLPVLERLMDDGERHSLHAQAPLNLFLGNAPAVQLLVNGEPYELGSYIRSNNTARLIINTP